MRIVGQSWRVFVLLCLLCTVTVVAPATAASAQADPAEVLFVAGTTGPPSGDRAIRDLLLDEGHNVTFADDDVVTAADAAGYDLVIVSSSVVPNKIGAMFNTVDVPVLSWEGHLFDDMALSAGSNGQVSGRTKVAIVDAAHPIADGATGTVTVASAPSSFSYGTVAGDGVSVASIVGTTDRSVLFTYESGSLLADGSTAAARRVGIFPSYLTPAVLNSAGDALIANAVQWALDGEPSEPVDASPIVDAGEDSTILLPTTTAALSGSVTDDGAVTSTWVQISGPTATIDDATSPTTTVTVTTNGSYVFELAGDDNVNAIVTDQVTIAVEPEPVDLAPTVEAGPDQTLELPQTQTTLAGTVTDEGPVTILWTQVSGPTATIGDATSEATALSTTTVGTYVFELSADDGVNPAVVDQVTITVEPEPDGPETVLFVAGSTGPPSGDRPIRDLLVDLGYAVTLADDDVVTVAEAESFDLLIVSSSVVPTKIGSLFNDAAVPMLTWEGHLFDDMALSAGSNGQVSGRTKLSILEPTHPIAGDLTGNVTVASSASSFSYGTVAGDGVAVASVVGDDRAVVMAYEAGEALADGSTASARRVAVFPSYLTPALLNAAGEALMTNAVAWALDSGPVAPVDESPVVYAGPDQTLELPTTEIQLVGTVSDDGPVTQTWAQVSGPASEITDTAASSTAVTLSEAGQYVFELSADDGVNAVVVDQVTITLDPEPVNNPPVVDAGPDQAIALPTSVVQLSGTVTDDGPVSTAWLLVSGPVVTIDDPTSLATTVSVSVVGTYVFELSADDGTNAAVIDSVTVTLNPEPEDSPPVVDAGDDQIVVLPTPVVQLSGSVTDDGPVTTTWLQVSGPVVAIDDPASLATTAAVSVVGTYVFELSAADGVNPPVVDQVTVTVEPDPDPEPSGPAEILFVAGTTGPPSGDRPIRDLLVDAGYILTLADDDSVTAADVAGFDLVVVSSSVVPSKIGSLFNAIDVPMMSWEGHLFDDMLLSAGSNGQVAGRTKLTVVEPTHPIADGLSGNETVASSSSSFSYATVGGDGVSIATIVGEAGRSVIFAYDTGAALADGSAAPARRVGVFPSYLTPALLNETGETLILNAVTWALGGAPVEPIDEAPTVSAGSDQTVVLPTVDVQLSGSVTDDGPVNAAWTSVSGPSATFADNSAAETLVTLTVEGTYVFELAGDDGVNPVVSDQVTITLDPEPADEPPVVNAGPDQVVELPTTVVLLAGTVTDEGPVTTVWTQTSGPNATINETTSVATSVILPGEGIYVFELSASDGVNPAVTDEVWIVVDPEPVGPDAILFVAGSTGPPSGDRTIYDLLIEAGHEVTLVDDDTVTTADADDMDLIIVTSSVLPTKIEGLFNGVAVPLVTWEGHLFDDMGLSDGGNGQIAGRLKVTIDEPAHPIAAGLTGSPTVASGTSSFSWGTIAGDGVSIASVVGQPSRSVLLTYDIGAELADGSTAPARRAGLFPSYTTPALLNLVGENLVMNAITWAMTPPITTVTIDSEPVDATVLEFSTAEFSVVATGEPPLTYQWLRDGVPLAGATNSTLEFPGVTVADDDGATFAVEVTSAYAAATSSAATLSVVPNEAPTASFTASATAGTAPATITFDATATTDDGDDLDFRWDFGDLTGANGDIVDHTFYTAGTRTVTLTVTDVGGLSDTMSIEVDIAGPVATDDESAVTTTESVNDDVFANDSDPSGGGLTITGLTSAGVGSNRWRVLPIRSEQEFAQGLLGGEAEQHPRSMVRSPSNPDIIYFAQDVGQVWRSIDNGRTWEHRRSVGLNVFGALSIAVDPVDPNRLFLITSDQWNTLLSNHEAIYTSADGGDTWTAQRSIDVDTHNANPRPSREHQENIAYDPTSVSVDGASSWYAAIDSDAIYHTSNVGAVWTARAGLGGFGDVHNLIVHPTDGQRLYLSTNAGLLTSGDGGATVEALGDLPSGDVSWVAQRASEPDTLYAVVHDDGLYRSTNGGANFTLLYARPSRAVFLHPSDTGVLYLTGDDLNAQVSTDGGITWSTTIVNPPEGLDRGATTWKRRIQGIHTAISPDPRNTTSAVAYSRAQLWRTEDAGLNFVNSSELFTGYNWGKWPSSAAFDPVNPDRMAFFLFDVGMVQSDNGGNYFDASIVPSATVANASLNGRNMHSGDMQPGTDGQVMVSSVGFGNYTGLVRTTDSGDSWTIVEAEEGLHFWVRFHPDDPSVVYAGDKVSTDGGVSFQKVTYLDENDAEIVAHCASNADVVFATNLKSGQNNQIHRSTDRGVTWAPYGAEVGWSFSLSDRFPTFAAHPTDCDVVYTLSQGGDLASFDGTTWTPLGVLSLAQGAVATNFVRAVAVDPSQPSVIYATMMAPGDSQVWRSVDAGATWQDISSNLPRLGLYMPSVHPISGELFLGSTIGTWVFPAPYLSVSAVGSNAIDTNSVWIDSTPIELPSGAIVVLGADGSYTYSSNGAFDYLEAGETATDTFVYTFVDSLGAVGTGQVTVTITGVDPDTINFPPVVEAGPTLNPTLPTTTATLVGTVTDPNPEDTLIINWVQIGGPTSTIASPTSTTTDLTFTGGAGTYEYQLFAFDGVNPVVSDTVSVVLSPVTASGRVIGGLLALYEFDETSGAVVYDTAGAPTATDLTIDSVGAVTHLSGGLAINASTIIDSGGPAAAVSSAVAATDELTVEAWIETTDLTQNGPARIVTISDGSTSRNFTLGQGVFNSTGDRLEARLRTTTTTTNGTPATVTPTNSLYAGLRHLAFTRADDGTTTIYIDGVVVGSSVADGDLSAWNLGYELALANEIDGTRPWRGDLYLVAIYDRALSVAEINQNINAGPNDITDDIDPQIDSPSTSADNTSITVSWVTDEPTVGEAAYGTTAAYEAGTQSSLASVPTRFHTVVVTGLDPDTTYQFELRSTDVNGNAATPAIVTQTTSSDPA